MHTSLLLRPDPCSPFIPYSLDLNTIGLHVHHLPLSTVAHLIDLPKIIAAFERIPLVSATKREQDLFRISRGSVRLVGYVYDIPTALGWATYNKLMFSSMCISSLLNLSTTIVRCPATLSSFIQKGEDIRPDKQALPEVAPYTQLVSVLYEALDSLVVTLCENDDVHLRNIYPYTLFQTSFLHSAGRYLRLAPIAQPPRVFSRQVECPVVGEILAIPGVVRCDGWITFYEALIPSCITGGVSFEHGQFRRFMPRSRISQKPATASMLLEDLTQPELFYLVMLEKYSSNGELKAVYHEASINFCNPDLGLVEELLDRAPLVLALGVKHVTDDLKLDTHFNELQKESKNRNNLFLNAENIMCAKLAQLDESSDGVEEQHVHVPSISSEIPCEQYRFVYKRDERIEFTKLDGYDGWCDEELTVKKHKTWAKYAPTIMLPCEISALYVDNGIRLYSIGTKLIIFDENNLSTDPMRDGYTDKIFEGGVCWSDLRPALQSCGPPLKHAADRMLLSAMCAGQVRLHGYFHCSDSSTFRHASRSSVIFMDEPLFVLGFMCSQGEVTGRKDDRAFLLIPVGPACTILMEYISEKYTRSFGTIYHSKHVSVVPFGCRLGDRSALKWYTVGAGPYLFTKECPRSLIQMQNEYEHQLGCKVSSGQNHVTITTPKGVSSLRLRDIGFEAGWSGLSPHLIVSGKGKRICCTVTAHSITQMVDIFRRIRDKNNVSLEASIQNIAATIILTEALHGSLYISRRSSGLEWLPPWKVADQGFVVPHAIQLPSGVSARVVNEEENKFGILVSSDTMAVFISKGNINNVWELVFEQMDASIESEKLLYGPAYEGFVNRIWQGQFGG